MVEILGREIILTILAYLIIGISMMLDILCLPTRQLKCVLPEKRQKGSKSKGSGRKKSFLV